MKVYSWNVNGIRSMDKNGTLQNFMDTAAPDVICMQEVKAHESQIDFEFPEYEKYWYSAKRKGYSGTAIWTKIKPLATTYGLPDDLVKKYKLDSDAYGDPSDEGRVLALEFENLHLITVYTPNSKRDLSRLGLRHKQWDPAFLEYVTRLDAEKPVVFCGDLNVAHTEIDLANPKPNMGEHGFTIEEREGFDRMLDAGFIDSFRLFNKEGGNYTWWTHWAKARERNVGWRIDYFLVSKKLKDTLKSAQIHAHFMGSDHCPISVEIDS